MPSPLLLWLLPLLLRWPGYTFRSDSVREGEEKDDNDDDTETPIETSPLQHRIDTNKAWIEGK